MTVRRLAVLIDQLAADPKSALVRAITPDEAQWEPGDWITAALYDAFVAANFKEPKPYPRPGDARREAERVQRRADALERQRARIKQRQEAGR